MLRCAPSGHLSLWLPSLLKPTPFRVFLGLSEAWLRSGSSTNFAAGDAPWTHDRCNQQCHRCTLSRESCIQPKQNRPYREQNRLCSSRVRSVWANKDPERGGSKGLLIPEKQAC